jgi:hypothetical protein
VSGCDRRERQHSDRQSRMAKGLSQSPTGRSGDGWVNGGHLGLDGPDSLVA